ncbi:MAG TPA: dienelactone hydrolase family protein [Candidatus Kryptonia bacterium]
MRRIFIAAAMLFLFVSYAGAVGIKTMMVRYPSGQDTLTAYLAEPADAGKHPALIVIHEWWGLTDWIKEDAREFASRGYVALAIDLYRGGISATAQDAYKLMMSVPKERGTQDLQAAFDYLAGSESVNPDKIGAIGWCMGGSYSFNAAVELPKLAVCIIDYGNVEADKDVVDKIQCPVLCNFAEMDQTYTPAKGKAFAEEMKAEGKKIDFHVYPGVNHAFMNPNNTTAYNETQTKLAWKNIFAFLDKHLKR